MAAFHLDHFIPQAHDPTEGCEYDNLVYVCELQCAEIGFVGSGSLSSCVRSLYPRERRRYNRGVERGRRKARRQIAFGQPGPDAFPTGILDTLRSFVRNAERALLVSWTRYPDDLPDLRRKHEPGNSRPEGRKQCCFARRERGELPDTY